MARMFQMRYHSILKTCYTYDVDPSGSSPIIFVIFWVCCWDLYLNLEDFSGWSPSNQQDIPTNYIYSRQYLYNVNTVIENPPVLKYVKIPVRNNNPPPK